MSLAVRFHQLGGPEVLRLEDIECPRPGPGEVRIRVKALGVNRADALLRAGNYIETAPLPSGLGLEAAGIIDALGDGVDGMAIGDAVSVVPSRSMVRWPAYGEYACFPAELVVRHPPTLSWEEAAAIWMQYVTAYGALVDIARLGKGEHVIVTAASSSVGLAAIQVARRVGAIPIAVTRTSAKKQALLEAGAEHVIAALEEDLTTRLKQLGGESGIRVAFDSVGGPGLAALTASMAHGSILILYGGLSPELTPLPLFDVLSKSLIVKGYLMHEIIADSARLEAAKRFVLDGVESGRLAPVIAAAFPFDQIVEAHRYLESGEQFGKIVVTL